MDILIFLAILALGLLLRRAVAILALGLLLRRAVAHPAHLPRGVDERTAPLLLPGEFDLEAARLRVTARTGKFAHWYDRDVTRDALEAAEAENAALRARLAAARAAEAPEGAAAGLDADAADQEEGAPPDVDAVRPIEFKPAEPQRFADAPGQQHIMVPLRKALQALAPGQRVPGHRLLTGLPGRGKTLLAKIYGNEIQRRAEALTLPPVPFLTVYAANLRAVEDYDGVVRTLLRLGGGVLFIDEIHCLEELQATKLYALMEDGVYPFHGDVSPTPVPDVCVLGATTDYGRLHPALKRRFGEPMMVRAMSRDELAGVIAKRPTPFAPGAVALLVERTHWSGAPYEAVTLAAECEVFARAEGRSAVLEQDVHDVLDAYAIDELGLRWEDRQVVRALLARPRYTRPRGKDAVPQLACYAASEGDLCAAAGLDPEEYRETVKGRLLSRGLLEVRTGYGQALTHAAVARYGALAAPAAASAADN